MAPSGDPSGEACVQAAWGWPQMGGMPHDGVLVTWEQIPAKAVFGMAVLHMHVSIYILMLVHRCQNWDTFVVVLAS